jgi:hypothetical protein
MYALAVASLLRLPGWLLLMIRPYKPNLRDGAASAIIPPLKKTPLDPNF